MSMFGIKINLSMYICGNKYTFFSSQEDVGFPAEFRFGKIPGNKGKKLNLFFLNKLLISLNSGFCKIAIFSNKRKQNETVLSELVQLKEIGEIYRQE
jgi:hypothetical protein